MLKEQRTFSIGSAATVLGCSASWLRLAERLGAIPPARRTLGGQRRYTTEDIQQLRAIGIGQGLRKLRTPRRMP